MNTNYFKAIRMATVCIAISCFLTSGLSAQWSTDRTVNNPVVTDLNRQNNSKIVSDGKGGAIVVWHECELSTNDYNIYAQRINSNGAIQWAARGVAICTNSKYQAPPVIASDGNGGALIAWFDSRNIKNEIFAQKIDTAGVVQWAPDGIPVGTVATHYQHSSPSITSDGSGGAIVAWEDWRQDSGDQYTTRAQRISEAGSIMWMAGGVALNNTTSQSNGSTQIISDGSGGAIVTWDEWVGPYPGGNRDVFAQKVNSNGSVAWDPNGLTLCSETDGQRLPFLAGDGSGGAIIVWGDYRSGTKEILYAQKVTSGGVVQWTANGIQVSSQGAPYGHHRMISDGNGGAIIAYQGQSGSFSTTWAQLVNADGLTQWTNDGIAIGGDGRNPQILSDGANGAIITWEDGQGNILAQRMSSSGTELWTSGGIYVCKNMQNQWSPQIASDGAGGAIISWDDYRNDAVSSTDIYAQLVTATGALGTITGIDDQMNLFGNSYRLSQNYPNPFSGETRIDYKVIRPGSVTIKVYDITGSEISTLVNEIFEPGDYSVDFNTKGLVQGVYYYRMKTVKGSDTKSMILLK
jgi:hypothetical protein